MQTTLARRQRHRRALQRQPRGRTGSSTFGRIVVVVLVVLLLTTGLAAGTGVVFAVGAYNHYAAGLPDPVKALTNIDFEQQTVIYDRTGTVELARLGDLKRELVTYDDLPGEIIDATTAIEDKDFWVNPGFDPAGIVSAGIDTVSGKPRGASTITQQLVRARLLPPEAFEGSTYERKAREIIQSIRLTQAFPGEEGKKKILTAYLNQNFYGNQSYGVKAAAKSYFGKPLADLTLAQDAILAAIPQSPTKFDLMRNATEVCLDPNVADGEECTTFKLVVPPASEIVQRRNKVLDLMKTRSTLTGTKHTAAEYEIAKEEPVELTLPVAAQWKAPHFVWEVRRALGEMLCPEDPIDCPQVDNGGYRVITTLDLKMQKTAEKWVYAAARAPNAKNPSAILTSRKIPGSARSWILGLRGHNIHNAAAGVIDYRTGEVLAYAGSASYTSKGNKKFQPQFDVLADGWRQPGSAIKPVDYAIGIDDKTLTAATMFMDVTTNFGGGYTPTQADKLERGPVRLRSALQFSLNIPAIKATIMSGLDHTYERSKEFGLSFPKTALPVLSMGIGTLEVHPIDLLGAYGTIANNGVRMPRRVISTILNDNGSTFWPTAENTPKGTRVMKAGAAYIVTDILAGNTDKKVNPFWGKWAIYNNGTRRPAAYKTGTTSDNRDVAAYGYVAPPSDKKAPAIAVGVWMGNSDNSPNDGKLSLDTSAPLWSAIMTEVTKGTKIAQFKPPSGALKTATVDAFTGLKPGPFTKKTVKEFFLPGTVPTEKEMFRTAATVDEASGLLWQEGCQGPKITRGFFNLSEVDTNFPNWQKANLAWGARAARGSGVRGPKGTRTAYFYNGAFAPFGRTWGAPFMPRTKCPLYTPPVFCDPFVIPEPLLPPPSCVPLPTDPGGGKPPKTPRPRGTFPH